MRRACMMIRFVCGSRRFAYHIPSITWRKPYLQRGRGIYLVVHFQAIFTQPKKVAMPRREKLNKKKFGAESFLRYSDTPILRYVPTFHARVLYCGKYYTRSSELEPKRSRRQEADTRYPIPLEQQQAEEKPEPASSTRRAHTNCSCGTLKFISLVNIHVTFYVSYTLHCTCSIHQIRVFVIVCPALLYICAYTQHCGAFD